MTETEKQDVEARTPAMVKAESNYRQKMVQAGFERVQVWVHKHDKQKLLDRAAELREQHNV